MWPWTFDIISTQRSFQNHLLTNVCGAGAPDVSPGKGDVGVRRALRAHSMAIVKYYTAPHYCVQWRRVHKNKTIISRKQRAYLKSSIKTMVGIFLFFLKKAHTTSPFLNFFPHFLRVLLHNSNWSITCSFPISTSKMPKWQPVTMLQLIHSIIFYLTFPQIEMKMSWSWYSIHINFHKTKTPLMLYKW